MEEITKNIGNEVADAPTKDNEELIIGINNRTVEVMNELNDWFSDFSQRVTTSTRYFACAIFASDWVLLINDKCREQEKWLLIASLSFAFVYLSFELIRYYAITSKVRKLRKTLDDLRNAKHWELLWYEKEKTLDELQKIADKSWIHLKIQLAILVVMVILMFIYLIINIL